MQSCSHWCFFSFIARNSIKCLQFCYYCQNLQFPNTDNHSSYTYRWIFTEPPICADIIIVFIRFWISKFDLLMAFFRASRNLLKYFRWKYLLRMHWVVVRQLLKKFLNHDKPCRHLYQPVIRLPLLDMLLKAIVLRHFTFEIAKVKSVCLCFLRSGNLNSGMSRYTNRISNCKTNEPMTTRNWRPRWHDKTLTERQPKQVILISANLSVCKVLFCAAIADLRSGPVGASKFGETGIMDRKKWSPRWGSSPQPWDEP